MSTSINNNSLEAPEGFTREIESQTFLIISLFKGIKIT